jgi:hypothetical protein
VNFLNVNLKRTAKEYKDVDSDSVTPQQTSTKGFLAKILVAAWYSNQVESSVGLTIKKIFCMSLIFSTLAHTVPIIRTVPCSPLHGNDDNHTSSDSSKNHINMTIKHMQHTRTEWTLTGVLTIKPPVRQLQPGGFSHHEDHSALA